MAGYSMITPGAGALKLAWPLATLGWGALAVAGGVAIASLAYVGVSPRALE